MKQSFMLVDINAAYYNMHRAFDPTLEGKASVVLTNNDGVIVTPSDLAKERGLKRGVPWYQVKDLPENKDVIALSSNYALYGSMSRKFMNLLTEYSPMAYEYSVDECFLLTTGLPGRQVTRGLEIKRRCKKELRLPVCVGNGSTLTLAKLANHIAKKYKIFEGVVDLNAWEPHKLVQYFTLIEVSEVWGVGKRYTQRLETLGIKSVQDLKNADPEFIRQHFSVVLERTVRELNGVACIEFEETRADKKQIVTSKSFGYPISDLNSLQEAVATYISRAAEKLRLQRSCARVVTVFIETSRFRDGPQYGKPITVKLPVATDDTLMLNDIAQRLLKKIYRPGFKYQRAGVMLDDIGPGALRQGDLLGSQPLTGKRQGLMVAIDEINAKMGKNAVRVGSMGFNPDWKMRHNYPSPHYTTLISDLPIAR